LDLPWLKLCSGRLWGYYSGKRANKLETILAAAMVSSLTGMMATALSGPLKDAADLARRKQALVDQLVKEWEQHGEAGDCGALGVEWLRSAGHVKN
jgi:hypothetical protein